MALDLNKENNRQGQEDSNNPLDLNNEPLVASRVSEYLVKSNYNKEATFNGYVESLSAGSPVDGLETAYRGYEEAEQTDTQSLPQIRGSVYQRRLEARQSNMLSIDAAIDSVLVDKEVPAEEKADIVNNLLSKREAESDSVERYATKIAAYAEGGRPSMMDKNLMAAVEEYQLKKYVYEGIEESLDSITGGASFEDLVSLAKKSLSGSLLMGGGLTSEEAAVDDMITDGLVTMFTPLVYGAHYSNLHEKVFPEKYEGLTGESYQKAKGQVVPGEALKEIKDYIKNTAIPIEERKRKVDEVFQYLQEAEGLNGLSENKAMKFMMLGEVLGDYGELQEGRDWDRIFGNVTGILDATVVGGTVVKGIRAIRGSKTVDIDKAIERLNKVNPEAASAIKGTALSESTGKVAESIGKSREEIIKEMSYPSQPGEEVFRSSVLPYLDVQRFTNAADIVSDDQKAQIMFGVQQQMSRELLTGAHYMPSASTIRTVKKKRDQEEMGAAVRADAEDLTTVDDYGTGFVIEAAYSGPLGRGFDDAEEAAQTGKDLFPFKDNVNVYEVIGDQLVKVDDIKTHTPYTEDSKYIFKVNREYSYNSEMVQAFTDIGLPENVARNMPGAASESGFWSTLKKDISALSPKDYLQAPTARSGEHWHQAVKDAFISQYTLAKNQSILNKPLKNLASLGDKSQDKVLRALSEANGKGGWQTYEDAVIDYGMTTKEYQAYEAIAELEDFKYLVANNAAYNRNLSQGFQTIEHFVNGEKFTVTGKIFDLDQTTNVSKVYRPSTDEVINIANRQELETLYEEGYRVVKTKTTEPDTEYQLINFSDGFANARPLDPVQLPYIPGYFSRIDQNSYFIEKDGVVVGSARTNKEAHRRKEELGADKVRFSRELQEASGKSWEELRYEALTNSSIIFGKRGAKEIEGANIANPIDSALQSSDMLSKLSSSREFTKIWRHRFLNEWGDMLGLKNPNGDGYIWPTSKLLEEKLQNVADPALRKDIRDLYNYYNRVEGINETAFRRNAARGGLAAADMFSRIPVIGDKLADAAINLTNSNPLSFSRGLAFYTLVASRPARQFLMQSMQPLMLTSVHPTYMFSKLPSDYTVMTGALLADLKSPGAAVGNASKLSKAMGMSEKEFKKLFLTLRDSGILQSIDHHQFSADTAKIAGRRFGGESYVGGSIVNLVEKGFQGVKKVGFDAGEYNNIVTTYLVAWNKYKKDNPGVDMTSDKAMREVVDLTSRYSLGMSGRANTFAYQDGLLSLPMQFFSIQHKAALAWWPAGLGGDKTFTRGQKLGMVLAQAALFGTDGLGFSAYVDKFADMTGLEIEDPEIRLMLQGGLFDTMLINTYGVTGSESFAPSSAGGFYNAVGPLTDLVSVAFRSPTDALALLSTDLAGAPGESYSRIYDVIKSVSGVFKAKGRDWYNPADWADLEIREAGVISAALASITTQGSDYLAGKAAMNHGLLFNAQGNPLTEMGDEQARLRQIFGFRTVQEKSMNEILYGNTPSVEIIQYNEDDATKDVKLIIDTVKKQMAYYGYASEIPSDATQAQKVMEFNRNVRNKITKNMVPILSGMSQENMIKFNQAMERELAAMLRDDTKYGADVRNLLKGSFDYRHSKNADNVIRRLEEFATGLDEGNPDKELVEQVTAKLRSQSFSDRTDQIKENILNTWKNRQEVLE